MQDPLRAIHPYKIDQLKSIPTLKPRRRIPDTEQSLSNELQRISSRASKQQPIVPG